MLSHLLAKSGIASTVVEIRSREEISETVRAGILEHGTVNMLVDSGVSDRVLRQGDRHDGIELRFNGESHRIDFKDLVGESVWLYPQTDVFRDLAARREADGGDIRYSVTGTSVHDIEGKPKVWFTGADGMRRLHCGRRRIPQPVQAADPGSAPEMVLPRIPLRLVRHFGGGSAKFRRADLCELREWFRPDQPTDSHRSTHVLSVRP
jgi:hypothetical protein